MNLYTDPNPIEALGAWLKLVVAAILLIRLAQLGVFSVEVPPQSSFFVAVLGRYAVLIALALVLHAVFQFGALIHGHLTGRKIMAALSLVWWSLFLLITLQTRGLLDFQLWVFVSLVIAKLWVQWRLALPGVKGATCARAV
jgi:hypothetical protein